MIVKQKPDPKQELILQTSEESTATLKICVGVITRNRPQMLAELLESLSHLENSDHALMFAVVENNDTPTMSQHVDHFRQLSPNNLCVYEIEPQLGIPFARNRVINIALREQCDMIAFIDDDETAKEDWITRLVNEMTTKDLDLVGGSVRLHPIDEKATPLQKTIWYGLVYRNKKGERNARKKHSTGLDGKSVIITSNWLCRSSFLESTQLRFDEKIGFSGGSDTAFFRAAKVLGAKSGWTPKAHVFETIPLSRLNIRYQYQRARDQSIASFHNKYNKATPLVVLYSLVFIVGRILAGIGLLLITPFNRARSLTIAIRAFGFSLGRMSALCGVRSKHYQQTHGN